ncbi:hypothetical protein ACA910_020720 [Epithemia clementina (nom. ined.)]
MTLVICLLLTRRKRVVTTKLWHNKNRSNSPHLQNSGIVFLPMVLKDLRTTILATSLYLAQVSSFSLLQAPWITSKPLLLVRPPIHRQDISFGSAPSPTLRSFSTRTDSLVNYRRRLLKMSHGGGAAAYENHEEYDEFGDSSFLDNVDFDQLEAQAYLKRRSDPSAVAVRASSVLPPAAVVPSLKKRSSQDVIVDNDAVVEYVKNRLDHSHQHVASEQSKRPKPYINNQQQQQNKERFQKVLLEFFGFDEFRDGQLDVIHSLVDQKRDAAVFWSTGKGKSLCYQIPALLGYSNKAERRMVVVVSPLISLMQDQVDKINGLGAADNDQKIANYLGSGQTDSSVEAKALQGEYSLLYVTPEKLVSGNFLQRLEHLHNHIRPIALFAIDEAHCVSEWGHDFRPEFRQVGQALRGGGGGGGGGMSLSQIPILALTATAIPRVQEDIAQSLHLNDPLISMQSFDRSNLKITVSKKPASGGIATAFAPMLKKLQKSSGGTSSQVESTIIYAPTRAQVEEIALFFEKNITSSGKEKSNVVVEAYHAGMTPENRHRIHTNFLTGRSQVIVATVAFGMGIDKPDTRSVVHYGPPKTVEEYFQQIGRAGRDGLEATCHMMVSEGDFDRYMGDFYLGQLQGQALEATKRSIKSLRAFALDSEMCRRKGLLDYFGQTSPFGERCGTCDNCQRVTRFGADVKRDFGPIGARLVLYAIANTKPQGLTTLLSIMTGKEVDDYRYKGDKRVATKTIKEMAEKIPQQYPKQPYLREILSSLVAQGLISESSRIPIRLPVPETVREAERKEEERKQKMLAKLEARGITKEKLPAAEVEKGDGEVIRAYDKWMSYLENCKKNERLVQLDSLFSRIEQWRSMAAFKHRMAPSYVLAEHKMFALAYTQATMPPGQHLDLHSLTAAGVRSKEIASLVETLEKWVEKAQPASSAALSVGDRPMVLQSTIIRPKQKWPFAIYNSHKKTGMPAWEASYRRFAQGESPEVIAMNPASGRPIQAMTVVGHILEALLHGHEVDVISLAKIVPLPTESEWRRLEEAEAATGMNVAGDPDTSGVNGEKFAITDLLKPIVESADKAFNERDEAEKEEFAYWCNKLKWYIHFRRVDFEPTFSSSGAR